jgi:hypothetical protein
MPVGPWATIRVGTKERKVDPIVDLIRLAAINISGVNVLPDCLKGATDREQILKIYVLIEKAENHLQYEANWAQARHPEWSGILADYEFYLRPIVLQLAGSIRDNRRLQEIITNCLPTLPSAAAWSITMRLWAGCLAAAKTVREKKVVNGGRTEDITPDERARQMQGVHRTAEEPDEIFKAGVPVGPFAKRHKRKPEPETVVYTGIPDNLQRRYFLDDIREHPSTPGAVTP